MVNLRQTQFPSFTTTIAALCLVAPALAAAEVNISVSHAPDGLSGFKLSNSPLPAARDAATGATLTLLSGTVDRNSGGLKRLTDGQLPGDSDEPAQNFFFAAGTDGGRILIDLQRLVEIKGINTYSSHPGDRGPQVYQLYGSDGASADFTPRPTRGVDPASVGWTRIASVDTRSKGGGQHAVSVSNSEGILGKHRYLLFEIFQTENRDAFGNTFYSEIDVIDAKGITEPVTIPESIALKSSDGVCDITMDVSRAPELGPWAEKKLAPVLAEWFPKIVAMLPSEGFEPPTQFSVVIKPGDGVAHAAGTRITANSRWLSRELEGEAIGALVHEVVHVVQGYWQAGGNPGARRSPGWLVEGIPDYIRFFLFEPETHGADDIWIKARPNLELKHDAGYRVTANFLHYAVENHDPNRQLIAKLNAACREGRYTDDLWKELSGKTLAELNDEWKTAILGKLAAESKPSGVAK